MSTTTAPRPNGPRMEDVLHQLAHTMATGASSHTTIDIHDGKLTVKTAYEALPRLVRAFAACGMSEPAHQPATSRGDAWVVVPCESHGTINGKPCKLWAEHVLSAADYAALRRGAAVTALVDAVLVAP